jgi:ring-1,2-phenylacetyl-CoA epoxidase subunit PaaD
LVTRGDILDALRTIDDPEMPINIVDLGIVEKVDVQSVQREPPERGTEPETVRVDVEILPTFVGCPALPVIENEIRRRVSALPGVVAVEVHIRYAPAWSVDRITPAGREALRRHGVTVPQLGGEHTDQPCCPYCGSPAVRQESAFGPTRCRMIWHCESCHHPFEHLKRLRSPELIDLQFKWSDSVR